MRKIAIFVAAAVLAFTLAGCSSNSASSSAASSAASSEASASASAASSGASASAEASSAAASASSTSSLFASSDWPQTEATEGVPVPNFSVGTDTVRSDDNGAMVTWKNVPESEVAAYVEELKAAGFTHESRENKATDSYSYAAYDNDNITEANTVSLMYHVNGDLNITVTNYRIALAK